ncbi:MAG: DUF1287 domain-containing protein [Alphaproteobacteria bacterium]
MRILVIVLAALLYCTPASAAFDAQKLVAAAEAQVGKTLTYDPAYVSLKYPGGDVAIEKGVCSDVVIRAYRAQGIDLQKLVHEDMKKNFGLYPKIWGLKKTDTNIDHRRVPNLQVFFTRHGKSLGVSDSPSDYKAGDIVTWNLRGPSNPLPHIGIVTDKMSDDGKRPLMAHNIGQGAQVEDMLFTYTITGHYRYAP